MTKMKTISFAFACAIFGGCMADVDPDGAFDEEDGDGVAVEEGPELARPDGTDAFSAEGGMSTISEKACTTRADYRNDATAATGLYGSWAGCIEFCPAGSFVYSLAVYDEDVASDNTAINILSLGCNKRTTGAATGWISSSKGWWGDWYYSNVSSSSSNPMVSMTVASVPSQGSGDDVSMLLVSGRTKNGSALFYDSVHFTTNGSTNYPTAWTSGACPTGQAVCGLQTRLEGKQGTRVDDTALNGVRIACCTF